MPRATPREIRAAASFLVPGAFILILWSFGFSSLGEHNVTWDDALGDLFYGERYLSYFLTFDQVYLEFDADPYPADRRPDLRTSPFRGRPWEYYPFANLLGAATSELLFRQLGWTDPFDGFHAVNLLFAALLAWVVFSFARRRFGLVAATVTSGLLFGSPRLIGHMTANVKDFSILVMFSLGAFVFYDAYESGSRARVWLTGACLGLALATKANALFLPLVPMLTLAMGGLPPSWHGREKLLLGNLALAGLVSPLITLAVWPYLWSAPLTGLARQLQFILSRKASTGALSVAPPFEAVALTTPPLFLLTAVGGMVLSLLQILRRPRAETRPLIFMWAWLLAVMSRFIVPGAVNYDGVRHFLEVFPPLALFGGYFSARAIRRLVADGLPVERRLALKAALTVALLLPGTWQVLRTHPYQLAYWNSWIGGYAGAREAGKPQAGDYWGLSYRDGMRWLNDNAEPGAFLAVPVVEHAVRLVAPERLRPDLTLLPLTTPYSPAIDPDQLAELLRTAAERPVYVMFVERRDWMNGLMLDCLRRLRPVVEWRLEEQPILSIYRYLPPLPMPGGTPHSTVNDPQDQEPPQHHVDHEG